MSTKYDGNELRSAADKIDTLMEDMTPFETLKDIWPDAGPFATAQWLERVVDDRRNAIVAHAEHLQLIMTEMATTLRAVADKFERTDEGNAIDVSRFETMKTNITKTIETHDYNTEMNQHNFGSGSEKAGQNQSDGDGYDDVLPGASGSQQSESGSGDGGGGGNKTDDGGAGSE